MKQVKPEFPRIATLPDETHRPFWSVMIPTANRTQYLEQTLRSVLDQAPGPDEMQIEVVDDCSPNAEAEAIVAGVGKGRVAFFRQTRNVGAAGNWNTCINRARGRWVHILHDDDMVLPGFYARLRETIEKEPSLGAAACHCAIIDDNDLWIRLPVIERRTPGILVDWLDRIAVRSLLPCPSWVVARRVYEALGGFCPEAQSACDWEMLKRIAVHYPVWYDPSLLACYRIHSASYTSRLVTSGANVADARRAIEISMAYLPRKSQKQLTLRSQQLYAADALDEARAFIYRGQNSIAFAQVREALKCSSSPRILSLFLKLLVWAVAFWTYRYLRGMARILNKMASQRPH